MKTATSHLAKGLLSSIFGNSLPSPAELTSLAEKASTAELACARSEAMERILSAEFQGRATEQAAMRQFGLDALAAATLQGNPAAARKALDLLEREYDR